MRTEIVETKVYKFEELSESAKERAVEYFRRMNCESGFSWQWEVSDTLDKFCKLFQIRYDQICYSEQYRNKYRLGMDSTVLDLSEVRAATYLYSNYWQDISTRQGKTLSVTDREVKDKRVKSTYYKQSGKWDNVYYSRIAERIPENCPLTGVCFDNDILDPIWRHIAAPRGATIRDILNDCISSYCSAIEAAENYENSREAIEENIAANEYKFTENGDLW